MGSWAAQGKENKEIKGAQDPRYMPFFSSWIPFPTPPAIKRKAGGEEREPGGKERKESTTVAQSCLLLTLAGSLMEPR